MQTIYRVEDPKKNFYYLESDFEGNVNIGHGPYCYSTDVGAELMQAHNNDQHPSLRDEGIKNFHDCHCAFDNMKSLRKWFWGYIGWMRKEGFEVVEYKVKKFRMGKSGLQGVFHPKDVISKKII
jgi:hypothetical protein